MQQSQRPEKDWPEQQRVHSEQETLDILYPARTAGQDTNETGEPDPFAQQLQRPGQGRQPGLRIEGHLGNDHPLAQMDVALHGTVGPVSLGRQGGLLQQKRVDSQAQQSQQGWPGQQRYLSEDWFDPPAYTEKPPQHVHKVLRAMRGQDASIQQVPPTLQGHTDQRGEQSAQPRPGQPSSRPKNRDRGQPTAGSRSDPGMHESVGQHQVTPQNRISQQTRNSGSYGPALQTSQAGHWDRGYPHSRNRGVYGNGGEVSIAPPQQVVPPMEGPQRHSPMPNQHFAPHSLQPGQEPLGQSNSRFPEGRRTPGKWECPRCWEQLMTELSFKRHTGRHLSQGC